LKRIAIRLGSCTIAITSSTNANRIPDDESCAAVRDLEHYVSTMGMMGAGAAGQATMDLIRSLQKML
jgi:hypothetical protein